MQHAQVQLHDKALGSLQLLQLPQDTLMLSAHVMQLLQQALQQLLAHGSVITHHLCLLWTQPAWDTPVAAAVHTRLCIKCC
jgi:hypothetical protein